MTTRPDGQMNIAAAFAVQTSRENKRTRSEPERSEPEHVQDLVTPKPRAQEERRQTRGKVRVPTTKASGEFAGGQCQVSKNDATMYNRDNVVSQVPGV